MPTSGLNKAISSPSSLLPTPAWEAVSGHPGRVQRVWLRPGPLSLRDSSRLRELLASCSPHNLARPCRDLTLSLEAPASLSSDCLSLPLPYDPFISAHPHPCGFGVPSQVLGFGLVCDSSGPDGVQRGAEPGCVGVGQKGGSTRAASS